MRGTDLHSRATKSQGDGKRWLATYLRSWARHNIRFGVTGGWRTVQRYRQWSTAACITGDHGALPAVPLPNGQILVASADILSYRYSHGHPDPAKRGKLNEHFLEPGTFRCDVLEGLRCPDIIILPVAHIYPTDEVPPEVLLEKLERFLTALPPEYRYALELRNTGYLLPEYFDCLQRSGVAHVLADCDTVPSILEQVMLPRVFTAGDVVVRAQAKQDPELQLGIVEAVRRCLDARRTLVVCLEEDQTGDVPRFLIRLMELLDHDLARLSPIRREAA